MVGVVDEGWTPVTADREPMEQGPIEPGDRLALEDGAAVLVTPGRRQVLGRFAPREGTWRPAPAPISRGGRALRTLGGCVATPVTLGLDLSLYGALSPLLVLALAMEVIDW